jgi:hypothetical protein
MVYPGLMPAQTPMTRKPGFDVPPAWKQRLKAWETVKSARDGFVPGGRAALTAIGNKDLVALKQVFRKYPDAWKARFIHKSRGGPCNTSGLLGHVLIHMGWNAALPMLFEAGDRFNQSPDAGKSDDNNGLTVLEQAVGDSQIAAVRKLLALGVDPDGNKGKPPLAARALRRWQNQHDEPIGQAFADRGANAWAEVGTGGGKELLLITLLRGARPGVAGPLLKAATQAPESLLADPVVAWGAWLGGIKKFLSSSYWEDCAASGVSYMDCAKRLSELGFGMPPLEHVAALGRAFAPVAAVVQAHHRQTIEHLLDIYDFPVEDLAAAVSQGRQIKGEAHLEWLARMEAMALQMGTELPNPQSRQGPRL